MFFKFSALLVSFRALVASSRPDCWSLLTALHLDEWRKALRQMFHEAVIYLCCGRALAEISICNPVPSGENQLQRWPQAECYAQYVKYQLV